MDTDTLIPTQHELIVLDRTGDTKTVWDPTKPDEVENARQTFDRLKKRGYLAYRVNRSGEKGEVMRTFDENAETMILAPPTVGG